MKVLLYTGNLEVVRKSGVGRAVEHQMTALTMKGVNYTTDQSNSYDVVHINTTLPDAYLMSIKAKLHGKKVVYHAHSTMEDFKNSFKGSNFFAPLFKQWIKVCYQSGDVIITPTEYSADLLKKYGIRKPIFAISNGIDTTAYQKDEKKSKRFREKYGYQDTDKVVLSVGHYMERKGILDFIEMAKKCPEYQFIWFGYTKANLMTEKVKRKMKEEIPNLKFPGYVSEEELKEAYYGSDVFLFMSQEETEGIVVLEALAAQIPVLVRDIPVYDSWLTDGVEVYKAKTQEQFDQRLHGILEGSLPSTVSDGYELAKKRDIRKVGEKLNQVYQYAENEKPALSLLPSYVLKMFG